MHNSLFITAASRFTLWEIILAALLFVSCGGNHTFDKLETADKLIEEDHLDSVAHILNSITSLNSDKDKARYNLVGVKLEFRKYQPFIDEKRLDFCIQYYSEQRQYNLLAEAYYYKGCIEYEDGHVEEAFYHLKEAETSMRNTASTSLRHKILETLADYNNRENEDSLSLHYGQQNLALSTQARNPNWIAYAHFILMQVYSRMGEREKTLKHTKEGLRYIQSIPDVEKSGYYLTVADMYLPYNIPLADYYIRLAKRYGTDVETANMMAWSAYYKGDYEAADSLWRKSWRSLDFQYNRISALKAMREMYGKMGKYAQAFSLGDTLLYLKEAYYKSSIRHNVRNIQAQSDSKINSMREKERESYLWGGICILILCLTIIFLYYRNKTNKAKREELEKISLINSYQKQIAELQSSLELSAVEKASKIKELERKIEYVQTQQFELYNKGKLLYDQIRRGESILLWKKEDYLCFISYYRQTDPIFLIELEKKYERLSPRNIVFEILCAWNKTDCEIGKIMDMNKGAIRTLKSRLKAKRKF